MSGPPARFSDPDARKAIEDQGRRATFAWSLGEGEFSGLPTDFDYVIHFRREHLRDQGRL